MKRAVCLLLLGWACFWGAERARRPLRAWRQAAARETAAPLDRQPPLVVFSTVALGGFRGLIADWLWVRSIRLQEEGKVFELVQLTDWITKLEPRFFTVWAFSAWNLAYNVSILFSDPEDRWRWVNSGIRLLRDEALAYNPRHPGLHRELGWLFQHKIGSYLDTAHLVYKWKLAEEMAALCDGPRPPYLAPADDPRRQRLQNEYQLDPAGMQELDREYGPLDWRLPATHAAYWASRGSRLAPGGRGDLGCDHMLCQCLAESYRHGRLAWEPGTGLYLATAEFEILPGVLRAFQEALARHPQADMLQVSYDNFLIEAAVIAAAYGRMDVARGLHRLARERWPAGAAPEFAEFLATYLRLGVEETPLRDAAALVEGFLVQHYARSAAGDETGAADSERLALRIWTRLRLERTTSDAWERTGLAPLEDMRRLALRRALEDVSRAAAPADR